jgi:hypothetical protein
VGWNGGKGAATARARKEAKNAEGVRGARTVPTRVAGSRRDDQFASGRAEACDPRPLDERGGPGKFGARSRRSRARSGRALLPHEAATGRSAGRLLSPPACRCSGGGCTLAKEVPGGSASSQPDSGTTRDYRAVGEARRELFTEVR